MKLRATHWIPTFEGAIVKEVQDPYYDNDFNI